MRKLALAAMLAAVCAVSLAAQDFEIKDGVLVKYRGNAAEADVPEGVTAIGKGAFSNCDTLGSVTLPASLASIGKDAFNECVNLSSVTLPAGLAAVGEGAFSGCGSLASITIPAGLTAIGEMAFFWCGGLISIQVDRANPVYADLDGVLFDKTFSTLIQYPAGKTAPHYVVPESVTAIGNGAFAGCENIRSVRLPGGLGALGMAAFAGCVNLGSITLPGGITVIEDGTFTGCAGLGGVNLPAGLTAVGDWVFSFCKSLSSITVLAREPPRLDGPLWWYLRDVPPALIYVSAATLEAYRNAEGWKNHADRIRAVEQREERPVPAGKADMDLKE